MKKKIMIAFFLFLIKSAVIGQVQRREHIDELLSYISMGFHRAFYPIIYPSADMNDWEDTSFSINVSFHINAKGEIEHYWILYNVENQFSRELKEIFEPLVMNKFDLEDSTLNNKSLSVKIFCYPAATNYLFGDDYFWGNHCKITLRKAYLTRLNVIKRLKDYIILPPMKIQILRYQSASDKVHS